MFLSSRRIGTELISPKMSKVDLRSSDLKVTWWREKVSVDETMRLGKLNSMRPSHHSIPFLNKLLKKRMRPLIKPEMTLDKGYWYKLYLDHPDSRLSWIYVHDVLGWIMRELYPCRHKTMTDKTLLWRNSSRHKTVADLGTLNRHSGLTWSWE